MEPAIFCEDFLTSVDSYFPLLQHSGLSQHHGEREAVSHVVRSQTQGSVLQVGARRTRSPPSKARASSWAGRLPPAGSLHEGENIHKLLLSGERDWVGLRRAIKLFRKDINGLRFCSFFFFLLKCILPLTHISSEKN